MNLDDFSRLAQRARFEAPPRVDVRDRVLEDIAHYACDERSRLAPLVMTSGVLMAGALGLAMLAVPTYKEEVSGLVAFIESFKLIYP